MHMADETTDSQARFVEESMDNIRKRLLTLEWDKKHNQLNVGMESSYNDLKAKYKELEEQKAKLKSS
jgi:hypothetical protein